MRRLTKLEKTGLVAAIVVGGSYFYLSEVVEPMEARLVAQEKKLVTAQQKWQDPTFPTPSGTARFEAAIERQRPQVAAARAAWNEADTMLADAATADAAIGAIVAAAGEQGLTLLEQVKLDVAPPASGAPSGKKPAAKAGPVLPPAAVGRPWRHYRLRLRGPYAGVERWLTGVAARPHALLVTDLHLTRDRDHSLDVSLVLSL
ncbi:MAG: hypothetical protein ACOCYV_00630 [Planctomycetota bacterium]